jgi:hypothetical protein
MDYHNFFDKTGIPRRWTAYIFRPISDSTRLQFTIDAQSL